MKLAPTFTVAMALALGTTGLVLSAPAYAAKKEKAPAAPSIQVSKEYRAAIAPIEVDIKAAKYEGMAARLDALSTFQGPDELFITAGRRYDFAKATNNSPELRKAISGMIDSGSKLATNLPQLNVAAGQLAYNAKAYPEAIARLSEAVRLGNKDADTFIILAEASFQGGKVNEGLAFAEQAVAAKQATGVKAPEDWYRRALAVAYKSKQAAQIGKWSRMQLAAYPTAENWRTALVLFRDGNKLEGNVQLDLYRLMRLTKSLAGERDFFDYAQLANERGLPGEAKAAIQEGMASGAIGKAVQPINELLASASAKVAGDQASLATQEKQAGASANGKLAAGTADAFLAYGQDAKAAALYKLALQKGQVDVDQVNTRLGIALARQGMTAEAKLAFGAVTGIRAEVAKFWLTWLDLKV
jgi:hypothetical protein